MVASLLGLIVQTSKKFPQLLKQNAHEDEEKY